MLQKYAQTILVVLSILSATFTSCIWMSGKFSDIECRLKVIETILIMKGIMPAEMAKTKAEKL